MATERGLRLRKSFIEVEREHVVARRANPNAVTELELLILAWKGVQELPPNDPNSFFTIAGYHGEPFRGAGWSNAMWWGGYCYHGQILFPTWHRAYINRLEEALRSIPGCETVTMPFLDWCDETLNADGLPAFLTEPTFKLSDGNTIKNSLYSYVFQKSIFTNLAPVAGSDNADYSKLMGYETVRFPLSGLVGTDDAEKTREWNKQFEFPKNIGPLNENIKNWLYSGIDILTGEKDHDGKPTTKFYPTGTAEKFRKCLDAPNYILFSNTSSAQTFNQETLNRENVPFSAKDAVVVPLESPHNDMHLAVGGFSLPLSGSRDPAEYANANGDMGENDTASFDPIFFLHHTFIDRMFWLWQLKHNQIDDLTIPQELVHYPGTNNFDSQGPVPGRAAGEWISLSTPLDPFVKPDGTAITSLDLINVETQLGYTYGPGSFTTPKGAIFTPHVDPAGQPSPPPPPPAKGAMAISGLNRGAISGSFVISVTEELPDGKTVVLGTESVLSRWHTSGCANCQSHLNVKAFVPLPGIDSQEEYERRNLSVRVHTHEDPTGLNGKHKRMLASPLF